jgi:hypothetical protein
MNDYDVDEFECETSLVATTPEAGQHFFFFMISRVLSDAETNSKIFFDFFLARNALSEQC